MLTLTSFCAGIQPRNSTISIARLKKGISITAATLGSIAFILFCVLLLYRRNLKQQQTIYPAMQDPAAEQCWDADDSDTEDSECSE